MFETMEEVMEAATEAGSHWFDADSMSFFRTVIESELIAGCYFITSEVDPARKFAYSVRQVDLDINGNFDGISTIGEFHSFDTINDALKVIEEEIN